MKKVVEEFKVKAEDGSIHDAVILQDQVPAPAMGQKEPKYVPGLKEVLLTDGRHMNVIDDDTFEIVESGQRATRVK